MPDGVGPESYPQIARLVSITGHGLPAHLWVTSTHRPAVATNFQQTSLKFDHPYWIVKRAKVHRAIVCLDLNHPLELYQCLEY
jgi:hypothetical protein